MNSMEAAINNDHDNDPPTSPANVANSREEPPERRAAAATAAAASSCQPENATTPSTAGATADAATTAQHTDTTDGGNVADANRGGYGYGCEGIFCMLDSATFVPRGQFLPDIDDAAMSQVQKYMILYEQDLIWSFVSDGIFLLGGVLYVILSLFDFWTPTSFWALQAYIVLQILAPLVYVLNSFVDIKWTSAAGRRIKDKRRLINNLECWRSYRSYDDGDEETIIDSVDTIATAPLSTADSRLSLTWNRFRKHAAHRRTTLAAFTFGIAATLDFFAVVMNIHHGPSDDDDDHEFYDRLARVLDSWQNYFYIISASICISGKRTQPWMGYMSCDNTPWLKNSDTLEDLGDLLFLIGSIIDTVLTECSLDDTIAPLFSSILWLLDACLYLRGDYIIASNQASSPDDKDSLLV